MPKVLIADPVAKEAVQALSAHAQVDERLRLPPAELLRIIGEYDALIVRSETKVTADVIRAGANLRVIARAGRGVDNIDLDAATAKGIVVVNAPLGNTISAAEHTIGLMLALARHIPEADTSLREGRWERQKFIGVEVRGKTLGIVGLGQVGSEVAKRARGLEMHILAHDPFIPEERGHILGVELVTMDRLLRESDFVSVHTTLSTENKNLIGPEELALMKPTARIVNTARGGLIEEQALYDAVEAGRIAGAAVDVFEKEPAVDSPLLKSERILVTPHLGASTTEAQERVALDVAEQVIAVLNGEPAPYAVNAPLVSAEMMAVLGPYLVVAEKTASLATQLCEGQLERVDIEYLGEIAALDVTPLKAAVIKGLLSTISEERVTIVNANLVAEQRGLRINETKSTYEGTYANLVSVRLTTSAGTTTVAGTQAHDGPHIVLVNDFWVDIPPGDGYLLICENEDKPGTVGAIGTFLGEHDVNISFMHVGREEVRGGRAVMVLGIDDSVSPEHLAEIQRLPHIFSSRLAKV